MKFNINKYSVHGLVNIEVKSQNPRHVKCLNNKYRFFSVDELSSVDIEVVIAPVKFPKETSMIKKGIYHIGDGTMFWKNNRKLVSWEVGLKGLENERVKVLFWGNSISLKYLCMHILEPLINIKLAAKDCVLMHASGVRIAGNVYVFSSLPGTGKTSLAMYLVEKEKANFLSDEFVILSRDAEVYNFAMPIALYDYNIAKMTHLRSRLSLMETVALEVKKIIRQFTNNRIKMTTYVDLNKVCLACKLVTKDDLKKLYVLDKITNEKPSIKQISIDKVADEIMKINYHQFRFFYDVLNAYLSEKPQSRLKTIYATQKEILLDALRGKEFSKMFVSDVLDLDEKNVAEILA